MRNIRTTTWENGKRYIIHREQRKEHMVNDAGNMTLCLRQLQSKASYLSRLRCYKISKEALQYKSRIIKLIQPLGLGRVLSCCGDKIAQLQYSFFAIIKSQLGSK